MYQPQTAEDIGATMYRGAGASNRPESWRRVAANRAFEAAKRQVRAFVQSPTLDWDAAIAFGDGVDGRAIAAVVQQFDLHGWPPLVLADAETLLGAYGAYVAATDTILLSRKLLQEGTNDLSRAIRVIVHEIGHAIDSGLNTKEALGDEGAIFAALVQGRHLSAAELRSLRSFDDHGVLVIEGRTVAAEFANAYGTITVDGNLSDWTSAQQIDNAANAVAGYALYGSIQADTYLIAIQATTSTDQVIGAGTTIWLNTDRNTATGYSPFGSIGADYNVTFDSTGTPYLYTGAAGQTQVSTTPLDYALSADGKSLEIAIPRSLVTPAGGTAPKSISIAGEIDNYGGNVATAVYLPGSYFTNPEYTIIDPAGFVPQTYGSITVDGNLSDWTSAQQIDNAANAVAGYALYGSIQADTYLIAIQATTSTDQVIGAGTTIWLNTDRNTATGYSPFGSIGADYNVTFDSTGTPYLYTGAAGQTQVSTTPLDYALSADGKSLEIAIPRSLVTPAGGTAPKSISIAGEIDNYGGNVATAVYLPGSYFTNPEYTIIDPAGFVPQTYGSITIDGNVADWTSSERLENPANTVPGYSLYGSVQADTYLIAIQATAAADQVIGAGTTIWLNTDQNTATGYSPFGSIGADYNVTFDSTGTPYLYTGAAGQTQVSTTPLDYALSADGKSLEIAIPRSLLTPAGGTAPKSINIAAEIDNYGGTVPNAVYLPTDYFGAPEYTVTDPTTIGTRAPTHRVAIVYSDTSAAHFFNQTAYSDLFMAAQNQAREAGVSYDVIDESQLTNVNNLLGYDVLVFPNMTNVNTAQLPQIMSALTSAVYNYHVSIITSGDFLTNDQTGAALPGNSYSNMTTLLNLARYTGGNSGTVTITANDVSNPIMQGYSTGQTIQSYTNESYTGYQGVTVPADVLVNQNVSGVGTIPGVVTTTTGATNVHFATSDLLADGNLLSHAIQSVVLGTQAGVTLHTSRQAGIFGVRMDMDESQYPTLVSPVDSSGNAQPGIYSKMIPILQQWKQQYNFVGSYYINIGDNPTGTDIVSGTNWGVSLPYYQQLQALGSEIGNHSYTHLINPPTMTVTETTSTDTPAGTNQITLNALPSFSGVTVGMFVSGTNIGAEGTVVGGDSAIAPTQITAVNGNTITITFLPGGYGTPNIGTLGDIPAGSTLTFSVPDLNTNFLERGTGGVNSATGSPFTYDFEFNTSKAVEQQKLGTTIYGAAIPGANETYATDQNILPYYQSANGHTGYLTGGWTGIGSGYPSAFGYMSPTDQSSVYIAPNMTFDFSEIEFEHKSLAQAEADWTSQFNQITADASGTPVVVWPIHDYGVAAWDTTGTGAASPYTSQLFANVISMAHNANYEFVTLEDLASRIAAQEKAAITSTTSGNTITATVTPDPTAPDLGAMALEVINGGSNVIANAGSWYAYNAQELFVPRSGGTFTVNLGATQDDLTHISSLPSRADLLGVTGNGTNLSFSMTGDGQVVVNLKNPSTSFVSIQGSPTASLAGDVLTLTFADTLTGPTYTPLEHDVSIEEGPTEFLTSGNDIMFGTAGNDLFTAPGGGDDTIFGDGGSDTIVYSGPASAYSVVLNTDGSTTVTDLRAGSPDGTDHLIGIASIDFGAPAATTIVASGTGITNGAGDVGIGTVVTLTVTFSQAVTVAGGVPTLTLNDGGVATYTGGSSTSALTFTYVAAAGQNIAALGVSSAALGGATIRNAGGIDVDFTTLPSLSGVLQIDTLTPTPVSARASGARITDGSGYIGVGSTVTLAITFNEAVIVAGGSPTLSLNDGGIANFVGGSGTNTLTFTYVVAVGQNTADLAITALNLAAGTTLQNGTGANAALASMPDLAGALQIDGTVPTIAAIASSGTGITNGSGALGMGSTVTLTVTFNEAVIVGGAPTLLLNDNGVATYTGGSGTNTLTFTYTVATGQVTPDLAVTAFNLPAGATLANAADVNAVLTPVPDVPGTLQIDGTVPSITAIAISGAGITNGTGNLGAGSIVTLTVTFNEAVILAGGAPTLSLSDNGVATYTGGSGTNSLTFSYVVAAGQNTPDLAISAFNLVAGATLRNAIGTDAVLSGATNYNPAGTLRIDTTGPAIASIVASGTSITSGTGVLKAGQTVTLTVNFPQAVTVAGGTPTLSLNDGGVASYVSGSGTKALTFRYVVAAGENTPDLTVSSFNLPTGVTIRNAAGANADLSAAINSNPAGTLQIDTVAPAVLSATASGTGVVDGTGVLNAGKQVTLSLTFSEAVNVTGTPALRLNDSGTATYASGSGTNTLIFTYTVAAGQNTADLTVASLVANGAAIRDAAGNAVSLTAINPPGTLQIDTTAPKVSSIVASGPGITNGAGDLNAGKVVTLTANFSEAVTVAAGTPTLALNDGGVASYAGGSGTSALSFLYTVAAGQNTADLTVLSSSLNGATVQDTAGNVFTTLAGAVNPAGTLQVDTTAPTIAITSVGTNNVVTTAAATSGFAINGTTVGVENGQVVAVSLLNAAQQVVGSFTATDRNNAWSASVPAAQAKALADSSYTATAAVSDKAGNAASPASLAFFVNEVPEVPKLTIAKSSLTVNAGSSVALGITATPVNSDNVLSISLSGLPSYESITAPAGNTVTNTLAANGTYTWTVMEGATTSGKPLTGLVLSSSYTGTDHPVASLTVTASNSKPNQPVETSTARTLTVTDPPVTAPITGTIVLNVSEDAILTNAQFLVSVDGKSGGLYTTTASHAAGQSQAITISNVPESFQPHDMAITLLVGALPLSANTGPHLYLNSTQIDGTQVAGGSATFLSVGTQHITASAPSNFLV